MTENRHGPNNGVEIVEGPKDVPAAASTLGRVVQYVRDVAYRLAEPEETPREYEIHDPSYFGPHDGDGAPIQFW